MTLGEKLDRHSGIGPGFDHLRIGLSVAILAWHSFGLSYGQMWVETVPPVILASLAMLLPMFFGLSGFLVMGSAYRTRDVRTFITFRVLRILPALFVEIMLSAIVLGAVVTTLPLSQYFKHPQFFEYFGSLIGAIKYWLPGVFTRNPFSVVNGALWTVGPEILCYCFVAAMMVTGIFIRLVPMLICSALYLIVCILSDQWNDDWNLVHLPTKALILSFIAGNIIYLCRYKIRFHGAIFIAAMIVSVGSILISQNWNSLRPLAYVAAVAIPYCSTYIGLSALSPLPFFNRGDYSYGIYIYAFPIQQSIVHYFPDTREWWFNLILALPITILFAVASWHLIEKPFLGLRRRFVDRVPADPRLDQHRLALSKIGALLAITLYGLFVMNAARVFPLKQLYSYVTGSEYAADKKPDQF